MPVPHEWLIAHAVADGIAAMSATILVIVIFAARKRIADTIGRMILLAFAVSFICYAAKNFAIVLAVATGWYAGQVIMEVVTASSLVATSVILVRLLLSWRSES